MEHTIKGIVFDFDGLIIDTESALFETFKEILKEYDRELPLPKFASYIGTDSEGLYDYLIDQCGGHMTREEMIEKSHLLHKEKLEVPIAREGVKEYLDSAKKLGFKIGLATSSNREWIDHFLQKLQLLDYFDAIQTRDDVEKVKPDPTLYKNVVEKMNILPSEAVAFEDSANGAKAAIAAGLNCVIVPNSVTENLVFEKYHLRLVSMKERNLEDVLKVLSGSMQV